MSTERASSALINLWLILAEKHNRQECQGCELIGRPEKVSIGDQLETTFEVKWRPFGYHFEDGWRPIIKLSIVSSNIGSNNFGLRKMALLYLNLASLSLIFNLYKVYKNQNYNLSNIKEYSIIVCWKAEFCSFSYEMLRISKGKETLTLKGDHLETNFQGFYQKSLHWRPRSPMETSVHNPASVFDTHPPLIHVLISYVKEIMFWNRYPPTF